MGGGGGGRGENCNFEDPYTSKVKLEKPSTTAQAIHLCIMDVAKNYGSKNKN